MSAIREAPSHRRLRGYAFDPSLSLVVDTAEINDLVYSVRWEEEGFGEGPVGEYVEVVDYDPTIKKFYPPVDLNDAYVLANDGLEPSESNPQFHQQMVYAVSMPTIQSFERALGRKILVVFYKVAHHLSHNGTARSVGLEMMNSQDLAAMATLDYNVISSGWKTTMPNRMILKELLERTRGRTMVMNTDGLFYDLDNTVTLKQKTTEFRQKMSPEELAAFKDAFDDSSEFYTEFVVEL